MEISFCKRCWEEYIEGSEFLHVCKEEEMSLEDKAKEYAKKVHGNHINDKAEFKRR